MGYGRLAGALPAACLAAWLLLSSCSPRTENPGGGKTVVKNEAPREETAPLHPAFTLSREELSSLLRDLPEETRGRILRRPYYFLDLTKKILEGPEDLVILVDKRTPLPATYEPEDLVDLRNYPLKISRTNLRLRAVMMTDLLAMAEAARKTGIELLLSSAYRSYSYQKTVYERIVREMGLEAANRESARPGHSQHQLGTAIDFGSISDAFTGTAMQRWLAENAGTYGFSLSYPEGYEELTGYRHESWHFRYIGKPAAEMEREFFGGIQQYLLEFLRRNRDYLRASERERTDSAEPKRS